MTELVSRGFSSPAMRMAECKDCAREVRKGTKADGEQYFTYPESWANGQLDRGGSRTDRCRDHRQRHQQNIAGMAIAYIDLATVGEVVDPDDPSGPLGGLGPLPKAHRASDNEPVDLDRFGFGMDESHIREILDTLARPDCRVLVVKAGTGTGKSTYMPYRLLDPPQGCFRLADLGPIVVTEPRVQATVGVAEFVGNDLSGAGGVGPGYPVGFQVSGNKQHDAACQLVYVTDGTMINWMREGRLSQIGTVIVDEAHERSTNIDFILGYLRRELPRYPHLRVIVTSATFNADFYRQFYADVSNAEVIEIEAVKTIGYGWPLFPELDVMQPNDPGLVEGWENLVPHLNLRPSRDEEALVTSAWPAHAPPLKEGEATDPRDVGYVEDLHNTTRKLLPLRFQDPVPERDWKAKMPEVLGRYVVKLANGLDKAGIYGDILGFLPTGKNIETACEIIRAGIGDRADVFALLSSLPADDKRAALAPRRKGDRRKIVVSTNLAETSLTVEGVRFVVDSGLIAQSEWNPETAQGGIMTKAHSQAGIRQRWGRVGRKAPGWVFPLYTKAQLLELAEDTDPGSTRDNLENLLMTARLGGIDDVVDFPWPAAFLPEPPVELDETAVAARNTFLSELVRANEALGRSGAIDDDGHPTSFGKELSRFSALGSAACAVAVMYADRLGCVPEVVTVLGLLRETHLVGQNGLLLDRPDWPTDWRLEASDRHQALADACEDDAELVLQVCAAWERADSDLAPWEPSAARTRWAARWWVNDELLRDVAVMRRDVLASLSPMMKEEVKRFIEPALLRRARGVISRAMANLEYRRVKNDRFAPVETGELEGTLDPAIEHGAIPDRIVPLARRTFGSDKPAQLSNLVSFEPWALDGLDPDTTPTSTHDAMRLLVLSGDHAAPDLAKDLLGAMIESWPAGMRIRVSVDGAPARVTAVHDVIEPAAAPLVVALAAEADIDDPDDPDDDASETDAAPELDGNWPTENESLPDTEWEARRALLDSRVVEAHEAACGQCEPCLAGRPACCTDPLPVGTDTTDVLERWTNRATVGIDVSAPLVDLSAEHADIWWEVIGYAFAPDGEPIARLRPDWRAPGHVAGPAEHTDLVAGHPIDLTVGELIKCRRDEVRILYRPDGLGRFVLAEAHVMPSKQEELDQTAISLSRRRRGLLGRLVEGSAISGHVLPRPEAGCATVTLLELLRQHLDKAYPGGPPKVPLMSESTPRSLRMYPTTVTSEPNPAGYVDVELAVADPLTGIVHLASAAPSKGAPTVDEGLAIRLAPEKVRLPLRDKDLRPIRALIHDDPTLAIVAADVMEPDDGADAGEVARAAPDASNRPSASSSAEVDPDLELGGYDTALESSAPVHSSIAVGLSELAPDPTWRARVWQFWARSRHLVVDRTPPQQVPAPTPVEVPALLGEEHRPAKRLTHEEATEQYLGGTFNATVTGVHASGALAWLELDDGIGAMVHKSGVGPSGVRDLQKVVEIGHDVIVVVREVGLHKGAIQLQVSIPEIAGLDIGIRTVDEALARYPVDSVISDAKVTGITAAGDRAWLALPDGSTGTLSRNDVGRQGVDNLHHHLQVGDEHEVVVLGAHAHRDEIQVDVGFRDFDTADPLAQAQDLYRPGGTTTATVQRVSDDVGRAWLQLPDGTTATVTRSEAGVLLLSSVLTAGDSVRVRVEEVGEHRGQAQVRVSIPNVEVPSVVEQARQAGLVAGQEVTGTIKNVHAQHGLFVEVVPGLGDGRVALRSLPNGSTSGFSRGDQVAIQVLSVAEDKRQAGKLLTELRLIRRI